MLRVQKKKYIYKNKIIYKIKKKYIQVIRFSFRWEKKIIVTKIRFHYNETITAVTLSDEVQLK